MTIKNSNFTGNSIYSGGAIHFITSGEGKIENCKFENNEADLYSGGVYSSNSDSLEIKGSIFIKNKAVSGGGLYISNTKNV